MQIGLWGKLDDSYLSLIRQLGVTGALYWGIKPPEGRDVIDYLELVNLKARYNDAGLELFTLENLGNQAQFYDPIILGWAQRDEKIEQIADCIRIMGQVGIPHFGFHWMVAPQPVGTNPVFGTSHSTRVRGDATVRSFDLEKAKDARLFRDRDYAEEEIWSNFDYFVKALLPVAEEAGVKLSLHPDDPPIPTFGGIPRLFGTFEGFKRATEIADSPNIGVCLCVGCWLEGGAAGMGVDVVEAIRWFGERDKLFKVHFRNVSNPMPEPWQETFIDDGYQDMYAVMRALREVGFDGAVIPDHIPEMVNGSDSGLAYSIGYMRALVQAVNNEHAATAG